MHDSVARRPACAHCPGIGKDSRRRRPPSGWPGRCRFVYLLADGRVHRVNWRCKQTMPKHSDWPGEINVYRLDNDYWDCYYE